MELSGRVILRFACPGASAYEPAAAVIAFRGAVVAERHIDPGMAEGLAAVAGHFLHFVIDFYNIRH